MGSSCTHAHTRARALLRVRVCAPACGRGEDEGTARAARPLVALLVPSSVPSIRWVGTLGRKSERSVIAWRGLLGSLRWCDGWRVGGRGGPPAWSRAFSPSPPSGARVDPARPPPRLLGPLGLS